MIINGKQKGILCSVLFVLCNLTLSAQRYDTVSLFNLPIQLDTFVIRKGFDLSAFIRRVKEDTTFYKAFKNMRFVPYIAVNNIAVYDKRDNISASLYSKTKQERTDNCRITKVLEEHTTGDFLKRNGSYNYYTAELFDYLFFSWEPTCNETDILSNDHGKGQMEKRKYELKQLIFNPGSKVSGVPFMGDRASIFDAGESEKYNFKVTREIYDSVQCYVFKITPKAGYEKKVLYDELTTWFRLTDYSIVARNYSLSYHTLLYDFDVKMKVHTSQIGKKLYPTSISYDGDWHVFSQKREKVKFTVAVTY
jgi:hypothetical protein